MPCTSYDNDKVKETIQIFSIIKFINKIFSLIKSKHNQKLKINLFIKKVK